MSQGYAIPVAGPPGPPGPAGGSITVNSGEALGGHRVVMLVGSDAFYNDPTDTATCGKAIGVTTSASLIGTPATVTAIGPVVNAGWGLTPGALYFATASGMISTTPLSVGVSQVVGIAVDADTLNVQLEQPVILI